MTFGAYAATKQQLLSVRKLARNSVTSVAHRVMKTNVSMQLTRIPRATALVLSFFITGCGSGLARVGGTVTLDDKPLAGGRDLRVTVLFVPESGSGTTGAALVDADGRYSLSTGAKSGIQPGDYLVAISAVEVIRPKDESAPPGSRPLTAQHYADPKLSGFRAEVQPGSNTFDFNLRSDARG